MTTRHFPAALLLAVFVSLSCERSDAPTGPTILELRADIVDAGQSTTQPHFFFLPPMVAQPRYAGVFDDSLSPVVEICEHTGTQCATPLVARFTTGGGSSDDVRVDAREQHYIVNWQTRRFALAAQKTYRVRVLVAGTELGFADVRIAQNASELKNIDPTRFVGIVNGQTLPIKFRIEQGAVFVVGAGGGTINARNGQVTLVIPPGALSSELGITVEPMAPALLPADPWFVAGSAFELGPTGTHFAQAVTLTIRYEPGSVPSGVSEAALGVQKLIDGHWQTVGPTSADVSAHTVTGTISGFSGWGIVGVPVSVTLSPNPMQLPMGVSLPLTATVRDAAGNVLPPTSQMLWFSLQPQYATVAQIAPGVALVTSKALGQATIVAHVGSAAGSATVNVVPGQPASVTIISGNGQTGPAGLTLPAPLVVKVSDAFGNAVSGVTVTFATTTGGTLTPATATTNASGEAQASWQLGAGVGAQTATATVTGVPPVTFNVTATLVATVTVTPNPLQIFVGSTGVLTAVEKDAAGNVVGPTSNICWHSSDPTIATVSPAPGHPEQGVVSGIKAGTLTVEAMSGATSSEGVSCLPGPGAVTGSAFVIVIATPAKLVRISGNLQDGLPGQFLNQPLIVKAVDALGNGVAGALINWMTPSGGSFPGANVVTNANGEAQTIWKLGPLGAGVCDASQFATATAAGGTANPVDFSATAHRVASVTVAPIPLQLQVGSSASVAATEKDAAGNVVPAPGCGLTWTSSTPGIAEVVAGFPGSATVFAVHVGNTAVNAASWGGPPPAGVFGATLVKVVPGPPAVLSKVSGDNQSAAPGSTLPNALVVEVQDAFGNVLNGVNVSWTASSGTVTPSSSTTGVNGTTQTQWQLGASTGAQTVTVSIPGTTVPVVTFNATALLAGFGSVSAGFHHTCAITPAGSAYCWGVNSFGNLGDGTTTLSSVPVAVSGGLSFVAVSAGSTSVNAAHTCGITSAGAAYCWGLGISGQLGDGTQTNSSVPIPVAGGLAFKAISAGEQYTCGITTTGAAYCWGVNGSGQLGDGTQNIAPTPVAVSGGLTFNQISAGGHHTCGVTSSGDVYCWGSNAWGQIGIGTQLGNKLTPQKVGNGYTMVSAGSNHTCAVTTFNEGACWGSNAYGELGDRTQTLSTVPVTVFGSGVLKFQSIDAGFFSQPGGLSAGGRTCAVTTTSAGYCWGHNNGVLGDGSSVGFSAQPVAVSGGLSFRNISVGEDHACGVTTLGEVYCWGSNGFGQFGQPTPTSSNVPTTGGGGMIFARVRR
jgi:alpha-tubulin suppressor-like RCC1 family protein